MKKRIGIVSEGPTDYLVIKTIINKITKEDNQYLPLQPEQDMMGRYGNGWKGVWKWCKEVSPLDVILDGIKPQMDLLVIQMDGDVIRKEKEVHCCCDSTICNVRVDDIFPLYCKNAIEGNCPVKIPCASHSNETNSFIEHGKNLLEKTIQDGDNKKIIIAIPCDNTDAWIVAAYENIDEIEKIEDPWRNIIAKGKYYHNIRVRGDKKSLATYEIFVEQLEKNWNVVTEKYFSAKCFEDEVKRFFSI